MAKWVDCDITPISYESASTHSSLTINVVLEESTPVIDRRGGWRRTMVGSNRMRRIHRRHVYGERLGNIPCLCHHVSGGSSPCEVEPQWVHGVILSVDAMEDWEYARHGGSGYKTGRNGGTALLP